MKWRNLEQQIYVEITHHLAKHRWLHQHHRHHHFKRITIKKYGTLSTYSEYNNKKRGDKKTSQIYSLQRFTLLFYTRISFAFRQIKMSCQWLREASQNDEKIETYGLRHTMEKTNVGNSRKFLFFSCLFFRVQSEKIPFCTPSYFGIIHDKIRVNIDFFASLFSVPTHKRHTTLRAVSLNTKFAVSFNWMSNVILCVSSE
jgi:hypothetical protein